MKRIRFEDLQEMLSTALKYDELYRDLRDVRIVPMTTRFGPSRVLYNNKKWQKPPRIHRILSNPILIYLLYFCLIVMCILYVFSLFALMSSLSHYHIATLILFAFLILIVFDLTFVNPRIKGSEDTFTLVMPTMSLLYLVTPVEKSLLHELQHIRQLVKGLPLSECEAIKKSKELLSVFREKSRQEQASKI